MKISEVLKIAKEHLVSERFLCNAINSCDVPQKNKDQARRYVISLLLPWGSAEQWLHNVGKISPDDSHRHHMREYRRRWIDHMIAELERNEK